MFDHLLTFAPVYQSRVWGGRRLETLFGRTLPEPSVPFGESWEISDRPQEQSLCTCADGCQLSLHQLWTQHREAVFGRALLSHPAPAYPLLMKILDACDDLSIQVHPPAQVAASLGGEPKTEVWYVVHAEPGARLYAGLKSGVSRAEFEVAVQAGTVAEQVQVLEPRAGDCLFIPSGLIHAIGAGLVIYEIQQNSDTTYRVFDWNRVGLDGRPREMHVQQSLQSIDFSLPPPRLQRLDAPGQFIGCEFFHVTSHTARRTDHLGEPGEHLVLIQVQGTLQAAGTTLRRGDFCVVPACLTAEARRLQQASADAAWLEVRLPAL